MATDVFDFLIDILKINPQLVNEYAAQGPLYQMFYLFFFPAIFIIIFIWILSNKMMGQHKGLRILLAVGVYAFIILQGFYSWFVMLSKFWLFGLIALGFLYFISYRGGGEEKRGGGGVRGKILGNLSASGVFDQINPFGEYQSEADMVKHNIKYIYDQVVSEKKTGHKGHYQDILQETHRTLDDLERKVPLMRKNPGIMKLKRNLQRAMNGEAPQW